MKRSVLSIVAASLLCLAITGCGAGGSGIQGTLVENGQPFKLKDGEEVAVSLEPMTPGPSAKPVEVKPEDGSFKVLERPAAGKYRLVVEVHPYGQSARERYRGAFLSGRSPLQLEVSGEKQNLEIDLVKKTVTRK